jgi:hypothetical protein
VRPANPKPGSIKVASVRVHHGRGLLTVSAHWGMWDRGPAPAALLVNRTIATADASSGAGAGSAAVG